LEARFVELLESLRPRPEFFALFRAIVLDVWKQRRASASELQNRLTARLADLKRREAILEDAFLYDRRIDDDTYQQQREKLREDIAIVRIELEDARLEELDVEGLLGFAEHLLHNAARLWMEAELDQKQRLQRVLFPLGLRFRDGAFGTATTCMAFSCLGEDSESREALASPTTPSWNQIAAFLTSMRQLRYSVDFVA
jgi:hypothetical protein